ncbi:hypothetical protein [Calidifontibacter indicus]|uniref:hypothetical protein n=1 Tax=Calidifontibacter indicus TaxID=419650 RepID=UPI001472BC7E|nr:hypothetical protein [Calidifontibacter indicus]
MAMHSYLAYASRVPLVQVCLVYIVVGPSICCIKIRFEARSDGVHAYVSVLSYQ